MLKGSVVALITPFRDDAEQSVNREKIAELIEFHANSGTAGIVPCGTTGESPTLRDEDWEIVVSTTIEAARNAPLKIIAGTGSNDTREAVHKTECAAKLGADACLVVTPYYNRPSPEGIFAHYRELDKVGIPIILYDIPSRTGIELSVDMIMKLCEECPNIIGLKASSGNLDQIIGVVNRSSRLGRPFSVFSGDDSLTLPILAIGGVGVMSVAANLMPGVMNELVDGFERGDVQRSRAISLAIHSFCRALLKSGSNPAPIKAIMNHAGFDVGGCRLPLTNITAQQEATLLRELQAMIANLSTQSIPIDRSMDFATKLR